MAAVGELDSSGKYDGKVNFTIVPAEEDGFAEDIQTYDLGTHGLVALGPAGEVKATIPGHKFGKAEIEGAIAKLLN